MHSCLSLCHSARNKAVQENPAIADWYFHERIVKFIDAFYAGVLLGVTDYCFHLEWQHCGNPHITTLPGFQVHLMLLENSEATAKEALLQYITKLVSTINTAVLPDGNNVHEAPPRPTPTSVMYLTLKHFDQDLANLDHYNMPATHLLLSSLLPVCSQWPTEQQIRVSETFATWNTFCQTRWWSSSADCSKWRSHQQLQSHLAVCMVYPAICMGCQCGHACSTVCCIARSLSRHKIKAWIEQIA